MTESWLNYHHLFYFFHVAKENSISKAAEKLKLQQPTVSAQLKNLEDILGFPLFLRNGRTMELTEEGRVTYQYAQQIFGLGSELQRVLRGASLLHPTELRVGVTDSVPKFVAHRALIPVFQLEQPVKLVCYEGVRDRLCAQLADHRLDLVLSDAPYYPTDGTKVQNQPIGAFRIAIYGTSELVDKLAHKKKPVFNGERFLLPTRNTALRSTMDNWFAAEGIEPIIVGEFEDSALLKTFGYEGYGFFPIPSIAEDQVERHYRVQRAAVLSNVEEHLFAISVERKINNMVLLKVIEGAIASFGAAGYAPARPLESSNF